jgi:hypothetical protein
VLEGGSPKKSLSMAPRVDEVFPVSQLPPQFSRDEVIVVHPTNVFEIQNPAPRASGLAATPCDGLNEANSASEHGPTVHSNLEGCPGLNAHPDIHRPDRVVSPDMFSPTGCPDMSKGPGIQLPAMASHPVLASNLNVRCPDIEVRSGVPQSVGPIVSSSLLNLPMFVFDCDKYLHLD